MPVTVRNLHHTVVVHSTPDKSLAVEWKPKGDPSGEDIQQVPDDFVQTTAFLRAVGLGILQIETDDEAFKNAIAKQANRFQRAKAEEKTSLQAVLDTAAASGVIVITEEQIDAHIAALSKSQPSELSTLGEDAP